jgi:hypothetical protein
MRPNLRYFPAFDLRDWGKLARVVGVLRYFPALDMSE